MRKQHLLTTDRREALLQRISDHLSAHYHEVTAAYVHGSFVTSHSFCDIDVGVLTSKEVATPVEFELRLELELQQICRYPVDVRMLAGAPFSFSQAVIRQGRVILDTDPNLRADFEAMVLKLYFDFAPFRRRYLAEVLNAPV